MKKVLLLAGICIFGTAAIAQESDSTGLEGDNLDLYGVMELFKESESPEDFEKKLNSEESEVNNLDLDDDGEVDYIRVVDSGDSVSHALTLQVPVNEEESQDVAVIEMEQTSKDSVQMQVIGDSELYGEDYIIEPQDETGSPVIVNVYAWKPVRHIYGPRYVLWVSPWRYKHYPRWYKPWKRVPWHVYHPRVRHHHRHYRRVHTHRLVLAHKHYHRTHSPTFHTHHAAKKAAGPGKVQQAPKTAAPKKTTKKTKAAPSERKRPGRKSYDTKSRRGTKSGRRGG